MRMKNITVPVLAALSVAGLLAATSAADAKAKTETIATEVSEALTANGVKIKLIDKLGADALRISVSVSGEKATLTGEVAK